MLINFTTILTDLDEKPIPNEDKDLTLAHVCEVALLATTDKVNKLSGDKKVHRAVLAQDNHRSNSDIDIMIEDIAMLKEARRKMGPDKLIVFNPLHGHDGKRGHLDQEYLP